MNWGVIRHILEQFGIVQARQGSFERANTLLLLDSSAADRPGTVYVTAGGAASAPFRHALIVSVGPCDLCVDSLMELERGDLPLVPNTLLRTKHDLDELDSRLTRCDSDQEIIDVAGAYLGCPMFYLDNSYRILAISRNVPFEPDAEWLHMTEKGYLSPESARRMQENGDLDMLAAAQGPVIYRSPGLYPFTSVVCNVEYRGVFSSRLNVLCINGDTSPLVIRVCEIAAAHLGRLLTRSGKLPASGPLQTMLTDLLRGVELSEGLIADRLKANPALTDGLFQVFCVDVGASQDRQIAPYYASLLKGLYPESMMIPVVFEEQLILLAHADGEEGFQPMLERLEHFFATYRLHCGVSNSFRRISALRGYCDQAETALHSAQEGTLRFYRDMMLEHMISHIPPERTEFLISPDIRRLEEASAHYSFSLVDTLREYLACNCNLIRAAERLFVHKNTLLYRLNHIKGILQSDLNDADQRLLLMLSFKLLDRES